VTTEKKHVPVAAVFVHGLFLNGAEFTLLRRRLERDFGIPGHRFSYPTVHGTVDGAVQRLRRFVEKIDADQIHFIGHSLGGLVLCRYFERFPCDRPGRVVMLGSPLAGSRSARAVARNAITRRIVGPLVNAELVQECQPRRWQCAAELGVIAGTSPRGLGQFFAKFDEDCDGTVGISETRLPGQTAHLALPVSHMGMLLSALVARQVGSFLKSGAFDSHA
jgi:pimeloyl-ACP methyl ester carboxylesterase